MIQSVMDDSASRRSKRRATGRTGCAVEATLSVIGGIWKPVLVFHLLEGKLRFHALCRVTPSATPRMITLQLRELEADGIVKRTVFPEVPPRVEYDSPDWGNRSHPCCSACAIGESGSNSQKQRTECTFERTTGL